MTATEDPGSGDPTADLSASEEATSDVPAGGGAGLLTPRGETTIAPLVVEKVATRAAAEVEGVGGVVHTGLGRLLPWVSDPPQAQASADLDRETVALDLSFNVRYPEPVGRVTSNVRNHVIERLRDLTGLTVTEVNITVEELVSDRRRPERRVQ